MNKVTKISAILLLIMLTSLDAMDWQQKLTYAAYAAGATVCAGVGAAGHYVFSKVRARSKALEDLANIHTKIDELQHYYINDWANRQGFGSDDQKYECFAHMCIKKFGSVDQMLQAFNAIITDLQHKRKRAHYIAHSEQFKGSIGGQSIELLPELDQALEQMNAMRSFIVENQAFISLECQAKHLVDYQLLGATSGKFPLLSTVDGMKGEKSALEKILNDATRTCRRGTCSWRQQEMIAVGQKRIELLSNEINRISRTGAFAQERRRNEELASVEAIANKESKRAEVERLRLENAARSQKIQEKKLEQVENAVKKLQSQLASKENELINYKKEVKNIKEDDDKKIAELSQGRKNLEEELTRIKEELKAIQDSVKSIAQRLETPPISPEYFPDEYKSYLDHVNMQKKAAEKLAKDIDTILKK